MIDNPLAASIPQAPARLDNSGLSTRWLGKAHLISFVVLLFVFSVLTCSITDTLLDAGPAHHSAVIRTTCSVVLGPMTGAISRSATSGCCLDNSLMLLAWALPALCVTVFAQWLWRPVHGALRFVRWLIWFMGWFAWFFSGLMSLGHALS